MKPLTVLVLLVATFALGAVRGAQHARAEPRVACDAWQAR